MSNVFQILNRKEKEMLLSIVKEKSISRTELQKKSDLKVANFYNTIDALLKYGIIDKEEVVSTKKKGRPSEILSLKKDYCYTLYILISGDGYHFGVCNLGGDIFEEEIHTSSSSIDHSVFISDLEKYFNEKSQLYFIQFVTLVTGLNPLINEYPFSSFHGIDIKKEISRLTTLPVYSDSVARAAAMGIFYERFQKEHVSLAFFNLGAGIGVGLVHSMIPEKFWYKNRIAIGHWELDPNGRQCSCGKRGCLVTSLGTKNITQNALEEKIKGIPSSLVEGSRIKDVIEGAKEGDKAAMNALDEAAASFVKALNIIYSIVNFDIAAVGGLLCNGNTYFYSKVEEMIKGLPFKLEVEEGYIQKTSRGICYRLLMELLS
ncbi:MAG: ROK family protein [Candidatus Ornithospirochaeta sp.]